VVKIKEESDCIRNGPSRPSGPPIPCDKDGSAG